MNAIADMNAYTSNGLAIPDSLNTAVQWAYGRDIAGLADLVSTKMDNSVGMSTPGAMNAVYGPEIFNLPYRRAVSMAAIGLKAYRTGYRFQLEKSATKGTAGVILGGQVPQPSQPNYKHVEMPHRQLAKSFAMMYGYTSLPGIDDVLTWEQHMLFEGQTFMYQENNGVTARIEDAPELGVDAQGAPTQERVGLESLERICSSATEAQYLPAGYAIPWVKDPAITGSDSNIGSYRAQDAIANGMGGSNFDAYVNANYDASTTVGGATLRPFDIAMLDKAFLSVQPYGNGDINSNAGKVILTGFDTLEKIQTLLGVNQRFLGVDFAEVSVNGARTTNGRDTGFAVAKYWTSPILPDMQIGRGVGKVADASNPADPSNTGLGRILIMDTNHVFKGILAPPTVVVATNPFVVGSFNKAGIVSEIAQVQATAWKPHAKIVHIS